MFMQGSDDITKALLLQIAMLNAFDVLSNQFCSITFEGQKPSNWSCQNYINNEAHIFIYPKNELVLCIE